MRQGPHVKRGRGRGNRRSHVPNRNHTYDSNGPDVRIRGNAHQVYEKYLSLARDATASGDRVLAESCFQHAEHYFRILKSFSDDGDERQRAQGGVRPAEGEAAPTAEDPAAAAQPVADKPPVTEPAAPEAAPDPVDQLPAFVAAPPVAEDNAEAAPKPRRRRTMRAAKNETEAAEAPEASSSDDQPVAAD